ncbi:hypothetical protein BJF85_12460 [Saccharomonospora sp. CUA-673]|uniref:DUF4192 domain-containing protein n=1 Tax=Saccharomonospora sp. CUA-673 TaxID=1904969 RepID=UPI00095D7F88|nr:DUF4192 domain-containing protein [Saccharomonospora sp. CUA-673]OLT48586.1 hypothetical protein BJF85_12460 [Saccharomonospora sp. CUA-673]
MTTSSTSQPSTSFPPPTPRTTITLRGPGEIIAAVPYLLGFHPRDSVVLVAHAGRSPSARGPGADRADVGHVLRMDIPPEDMVVELRADLEATLRPSLAEATAVTVVIVGGVAEPGGGPAHQALMTELASLLTAVGVPIARALWTPEITKGAPWCDYARSDSAGSGPADRDGVVPDPWASTLAAASAHAGHITYPSREAMERSLESDDPELLMRRSALLELAASRDEVERGDGRSGTDDVGAERIVEAVGVVRDALGRFRRGLRESAACVLSDQQVVDLARA